MSFKTSLVHFIATHIQLSRNTLIAKIGAEHNPLKRIALTADARGSFPFCCGFPENRNLMIWPTEEIRGDLLPRPIRWWS